MLCTNTGREHWDLHIELRALQRCNMDLIRSSQKRISPTVMALRSLTMGDNGSLYVF
jgi:hypothetical protein